AEPDDVASEVSLWVDDAGTGHVKATLEADRFRVFETAMREARNALFQTGHPNVTWTDALVEVAERSLDTVTERSRRDRFRVNMYIHGTQDRSVTFADNWRVPDALRDLYLCDGNVTPIYVIDGIRSTSAVPSRSCRTAHGASSNTATSAAASPAAPRPDGCKCTTSSTAPITVTPTPGT
ncbi:MAG: hypothetical protein M3501_11480, partial [Actinomycetota bacterium]|nr:hypothetical protein [Actinomycetota bacterium]